MLYMMRLCRQKGRFMYELFPWVFGGGTLTAEEYVAWQAYDLLEICNRYSINPLEQESIDGVVENVRYEQNREQLRWKKLTEGGRHHGR